MHQIYRDINKATNYNEKEIRYIEVGNKNGRN